MFISFEGTEGVGKTTLIRKVYDHLLAQGQQVQLTREPGGTPMAEQIRTLLLAVNHEENMANDTELLLMYAARAQHLQQVIVPALAAGKTVLCDRFTDASFAYQGGGRGFDVQVLQTLESWVQTSPQSGGVLRQPDVTFWFDLPPAVAAQRLAAARQADRFEAQSGDFFEKVAAAYAKRAAAYPTRFLRLDAQQPPESVWQQLLSAWQGKCKSL